MSPAGRISLTGSLWGLAVVTGTVFGTYPALRAASLHSALALRNA